MGLYSAVLLLCTLEGNVEEHPPECTTMIHAKPFESLKQCVKSTDAYEMKNGKIIDRGTCKEIIKKHGRNNLEETFLKLARGKNELR